MDKYDLIIIGAGPAGITASIYAARKKIKTLVISPDIGGQAALSADIENYTGYQFITGPELAEKFNEHMRQFKIDVRDNEKVIELEKENETAYARTDKSQYHARSVIIASGKRSRELNVPGEKEFKNKGLTYCATCDGPLFAGKDVAIIGGGNSALDAALQMMRIARKAYLININAELGGDALMREAVQESKVISILNSTQVTAVVGDKFVNGIKIKDIKSGIEKKLELQGVFVEIGLIPNSEFAKGVKNNETGEIEVNMYNQTNIPGIFAAGDVTNVVEKQIIIAAGEGSKAALGVFRYLVGQKAGDTTY